VHVSHIIAKAFIEQFSMLSYIVAKLLILAFVSNLPSYDSSVMNWSYKQGQPGAKATSTIIYALHKIINATVSM